jgi:hypothetical protein
MVITGTERRRASRVGETRVMAATHAASNAHAVAEAVGAAKRLQPHNSRVANGGQLAMEE